MYNLGFTFITDKMQVSEKADFSMCMHTIDRLKHKEMHTHCWNIHFSCTKSCTIAQVYETAFSFTLLTPAHQELSLEPKPPKYQYGLAKLSSLYTTLICHQSTFIQVLPEDVHTWQCQTPESSSSGCLTLCNCASTGENLQKQTTSLPLKGYGLFVQLFTLKSTCFLTDKKLEELKIFKPEKCVKTDIW